MQIFQFQGTASDYSRAMSDSLTGLLEGFAR
jgi:hypothetical protein